MTKLGEAAVRIGASPTLVWPLLCDLIWSGEWDDHADSHQTGVELITALPPDELTFRVQHPRALTCTYLLVALEAATEVQQALYSPDRSVLSAGRLRLVAGGSDELPHLKSGCARALKKLKGRAEQAARG